MQVYHRGYYTCSLFGLLCILLRLPFLPLQLHLGITLQMQSNYSQMSSETATEGLLRAASGQESTHTTVTNATGHCPPRAICWSPGCKGACLPAQLHRAVTLQRKSSHSSGSTCAFPSLAEVLLDGRPTLQLLRIPSNHSVLRLVSFMYSEIYKGVQRHVSQHAKKEHSWYMCYGIRQLETKKEM